ncbi:chain-length determining protein [Pseudomonas fluorescens HK44]|uniref:Chain-length determining protein n=1 Tax=Pseudomonas fluorescens HK44 TaxID=1042209 RepID=A0A010SRV1_PSEFL|nr:Wzz/FepE/Etk N-terminal domain-containing protein [Pseudomonas fluorescens]EXF95550.1 chain-length determining protein [Pseudomonas fluorescens HK44]
MQGNNGSARHSDEIDLLELFKALWQQKWLVVVVTLIVTLAAISYVLLVTPVYESKYYISPPTANDIANLNYGRTPGSGLKVFTIDEVYKVFLHNLQSESIRRAFFEKVYLPALGSGDQSSRERSYETFSKTITIAPLDKDDGGRWSISLADKSSENTKNWVDIFVNLAAKSSEQELIAGVTKEASVRGRDLELQIDTLRESGSKERQDSITQLREALAIAKSSGLENPVVFSGNGVSKLSGNMDGGLAYMRGSKALEAELKALEGRDSNDPFILGLRKLQNQLDFYKGLERGTYEIAVFRHDGILDQPTSPIKPKKPIILVLGALIGALLGCIFALARHFILKRKREEISGVSPL